MLRILFLALCGPLTHTRADPGARLRLGMDIMNRGELAGRAQGWGQVGRGDCSCLHGLEHPMVLKIKVNGNDIIPPFGRGGN